MYNVVYIPATPYNKGLMAAVATRRGNLPEPKTLDTHWFAFRGEEFSAYYWKEQTELQEFFNLNFTPLSRGDMRVWVEKVGLQFVHWRITKPKWGPGGLEGFEVLQIPCHLEPEPFEDKMLYQETVLRNTSVNSFINNVYSFFSSIFR